MNVAAICFWLGAMRRAPSVDEIIQRWGVSRATAYRYRAFAQRGGDGSVHPLQTNPNRFPKRKSA